MYAKRPSSKFGFLALKGSSTALNDPLDLDDGTSAHPKCPIDLPNHWREWLGTLGTADFTEANLIVVLEIDSATPIDLDEETRQLGRRLGAFWKGILLRGVPSYTRGVEVLGGIAADGSITVKEIARNARSYRHQFGEALEISESVLQRAKRLADALSMVYQPPDFRRLRAGLRALFKRIEEAHADERLHQFVRALDGLMMLPKGPGRDVFVKRGPTFVSATDLHNLLIELYVLRNTQEHLNEFSTVIEAPTRRDFDKRLSLRAYQAEQAALAAYRHVLLSAGVLAHFKTEEAIAAFWNLSDQDRCVAWGQPFDSDAADREHDYLFELLYGL